MPLKLGELFNQATTVEKSSFLVDPIWSAFIIAGIAVLVAWIQFSDSIEPDTVVEKHCKLLVWTFLSAVSIIYVQHSAMKIRYEQASESKTAAEILANAAHMNGISPEVR